MADETIRIVIEGEDRASGSLNSVSSALGGISSVAFTMVAARVLESLGEALGNLGKAAYNAIADYQKAEMTMDSLLARELLAAGGAEDMADAFSKTAGPAEDMLRRVTEIALHSPFDESDVQAVMRIGMAYGVSSETALDMAQALADFAAGTGLSADRIPRLALALGQVQSVGYLTGMEMRQLTEAGLGVDMIARTMKMPVQDVADAIKNKEIAAKDLIPALNDIIETDFGGAAARMAFTWAGLGETITDVGTISLRSMLTPAFEVLEPLLTRFINAITSPALQTQLSTLGETIGTKVAAAVEWLSGAIDWCIQNWDWLSVALRDAAIAFAGIMIVLAVAGAIYALTTPVGQVMVIIGVLTAVVGIFAAAWETDWGGIRTFLEGVWTDYLQPTLQAIAKFFTDKLPEAFGKAKEWFVDTWNGIHDSAVEITDKIIAAIKTPFQDAYDWLKNLWNGLIEWIRHIFDNVHIPLPHFNVNWTEILGVRIPSGVSVDWYASGLDAVFSKPTLIGVGEAGAERVQVTPLNAPTKTERGGDTWNITIYPRESEVSSLRDLLTMLQMAGA